MDENTASGRLSEAAADALALAHTLLSNGHPLPEVRAALVRGALPLSAWPEREAQLPYYEALLARDSGDVRAAMRDLVRAESAASKLGLDPQRRAAVQVRAMLLQALGRSREALEALGSVSAPASAPPCERARLDTTRTWVELSILLGERVDEAPSERLRAELARLERVYSTDCPRPADRQNARVNMAIAALLAGDTEAARAHLTEASALVTTPLDSVSAWLLDLSGSILIAEGRPREALVPLEELAARASAAGDPATLWRALFGTGRALVAAGDAEAGVIALRRAESALDRWSSSVPLSAGRATFLADHGQSARALTAALLSLGRPAEAMEAARSARRRALATEARLDRAGALPPEARARWESAVARYHRARQAVDAAAEDDWKLAKSRVEAALDQRRALLAEIESALDDALAELSWVPAAELSPPAAAPAPGEIMMVVLQSSAKEYTLFVHDGQSVTAHPLPEPSALSPEDLAEALLAPARRALGSARRLLFLGAGAWSEVDVHALPFQGEPLSASIPVAYGLDLGSRKGSPPRGSALVVADPTGDLPLAAHEGQRVKALLAGAREARAMAGDEASKANVLTALSGVEVFHFAGHAVFEEDAVWEGGLVLGGGRLVPGDVLASARAPRVVVLSGCETGRAPARAGVDVSLANAFLAAGSEVVVATARPVADTLGAAMSEALYADAGAPGWDPVDALSRAAARVRAEDPGADWASYRALLP
ncbi:MAG: CHAT domain-containing protein [Polyangiaceae bacterium]